MCAETNYESQQGVVVNSIMGSLTTVRRACEVYAKLKRISTDAVTSAAVQSHMTKAVGGATKIPGLSTGNVCRNLSLVKALHKAAFDLLACLWRD